jgi:hypothetical protein
MKNIDVLSLISGIIFIIGGLVLFVLSFFAWFVIFYAVFALIIGIVILATLRKQEEIEPIKKQLKSRKVKI